MATEPQDRDTVMALASASPSAFYDERYSRGYQRWILESGYDACVLTALRWGLAESGVHGVERPAVLDLGCGQGRYLPVLAGELPGAALHGADVSPVAVGLAGERHPSAVLMTASAAGVPAPDASFDLVVMVDVVEHVVDVDATLRELHRLLRPGGSAVLTTPCANRGSIAWAYNRLRGGFEPTPDGTGRFLTDEPAHLRRLRSGRARELLERAGLRLRSVRWWGHLATPLVDRLEALPAAARRSVACLDWRLFRRLPNGSAMVLVAAKPGAAR